MSIGLDGTTVRIRDPELVKVVERARVELLLNQPFLAAAVMRVPVSQVTSDELPSGIGVGRGTVVVSQALRLVQPSIVAYGYAHNLMHLLFEHLERRGARIERIWDLAIDIATAALVDPLFDPALRNETADSDTRPVHSPWFQELVTRFGNESCEKIYDSLRTAGRGAMPSRGAPRPTDRSASDGLTAAPPSFEGIPTKCGHLSCAETALPADVACSSEERLLLVEEVAEAISEAYAQSNRATPPGTVAGRWKELARQSRTNRVPWQRLIAERFAALIPTDYQMFPFNKKHLWRGIYLPSIARRGAGRVVFAIDTSGSMSLETLGEITDQLDQLRQATMCSLTIVHFDHGVQKVSHFDEFSDPLDRGALEMPGRGGTDIRAPFRYLAEEQERGEVFAAIVVATDGQGPIPDRAPSVPTIWLVPDSCMGTFHPSFGSVVTCRSEDGDDVA